MNETRINRIIQIFSQLGDLGGARERTRVLPNREVIDNAPAGLANYIIVEDEGGYYIPAVTVPGVTYANGDLVNLLVIQGTEPIAFQHGSGSSGGGGAGWPFSTHELTVDPTDADAEYTTVAAAVAAAVAGDCIRVGAGVHTVNSVTIPAGVDIRGSGKDVTILRTTTSDRVLQLSGSNELSDFTAENNRDNAAKSYAIVDAGGSIEARDVRAASNNPTGAADGWNFASTTALLVDCEGYATAGGTAAGLYTFSGTAAIDVEGGNYEGDDYDVYTNNANDVITLAGAMLENSVIGGSGTTQGSWYGASGDHYTEDQRVTNTSGGTVAAGALGYLDSAGEFKTIATAYSDVSWAVVLVGGANNADVWVVNRGVRTVTLDGNCSAGDFLYTSTTAGRGTTETYVRPEVCGVALTANAGGAGGTAEFLMLCERTPRFVALSSSMITISGSSGTDWQTTENGAPAGAVVTYNTPLTNGTEDALAAASAFAMVLHNTTQGEEAIISSVNTGANTITVTAAGDVAAWGNGDTLEVRSQTNTDTVNGQRFFDIIAVSAEVPTLAVGLLVDVSTWRDSGATAQSAILHPWETGASGKRQKLENSLTTLGGGVGGTTLNIPFIQQRFTLNHNASGAGTATLQLRIRGFVVATP